MAHLYKREKKLSEIELTAMACVLECNVKSLGQIKGAWYAYAIYKPLLSDKEKRMLSKAELSVYLP